MGLHRELKMRARCEAEGKSIAKACVQAHGQGFELYCIPGHQVILLCAYATLPYCREQSQRCLQRIGKMLRSQRSKIRATAACAEAGEVAMSAHERAQRVLEIRWKRDTNCPMCAHV